VDEWTASSPYHESTTKRSHAKGAVSRIDDIYGAFVSTGASRVDAFIDGIQVGNEGHGQE
jgi:hypothetical protein